MATVEYKEVQSGGSVQIKTTQFPNAGLSTTGPTVASASAGYITLSEEGFGPFHITKLAVSALPVTIGNTTGVSFGSKQLITFPVGSISIKSITVEDFSWGFDNAGNATPIDGTMGGDIAIGTSATADATINGTEVNCLASTSYDPFSTAISARELCAEILDGTATPISLYLNALIDDADVADTASDVLEATATIRVEWTNMQG